MMAEVVVMPLAVTAVIAGIVAELVKVKLADAAIPAESPDIAAKS